MTRAARIATGIAVATPVAVSAVVAGAMAITGDERIIAIDLSLAGGVLLCGAAVSAVPATALLTRTLRRRADRRRQEDSAREMERAAAEARSAEQNLHQRFLARLDHELKNPLTAIRATAAAAQERAGDDAWVTIDRQATKLSTLVRDLRKLGELESRALDLEPVDLDALLTEAIDALSEQYPHARSRAALTVTRVPWPVPTMSLDRDLLSVAIDNVLGNAAKYSTEGPIEVRLREQDGWAVIDVADAGRGIPVADLASVFDELARATNARDVDGSGIGLPIIAAIMRRHGGDVSLRSVEGAGTVVTLRLPIQR